jgi:hypothetical protein
MVARFHVVFTPTKTNLQEEIGPQTVLVGIVFFFVALVTINVILTIHPRDRSTTVWARACKCVVTSISFQPL